MKKLIIAIDGPAASGKGTIAKQLVLKLNLAHLDTGSLYRAIAFSFKTLGISPDDLAQTPDLISKIDKQKLLEISHMAAIRTKGIGKLASDFSQMPLVRDFLLTLQKNFAHTPPTPSNGSVLDGRDIGTVICPDADFKFFITASPEIRAERRYKELKQQGKAVTLSAVLHEVKVRDAADRSRSVAPLIPAKDAILVDSSEMSIEACLDFCLNKIQENR